MCKICIDPRPIKGIIDMGIDIHFDSKTTEDIYFKDNRMDMRYTEIIGGYCGDTDGACKVYINSNIQT